MTRSSSDDTDRPRPDHSSQSLPPQSNPRYIAGPPLTRGILYRSENSGTVLVPHAVLSGNLNPIDSEISLQQCSVIPEQEMGGTRTLVVIPPGLWIAIPEELLQLVINARGRDRLGPSAIAEVRRVRKLATDVGGIGFWNQRAIHFRFLEPPRANELLEWRGEPWGRSECELRQIGTKLHERLQRIDPYVRGYIGWLMSNPSYRTEHRQLLREFQQEIEAHGFPARRTIMSTDPLSISPFQERCLRHYERWILDGVVAPDLPVPVPPQFPNLMQSEGNGGTLSHTIPAYFPVSGQSWMLDMLDDARPTNQRMPHLSDWLNLIQKENASLNKIAGYCRRLRLLHYWRGLIAAFPEGLRRSKNKLTSTFADFLKAGEDTIKSDLKVLGPLLSEKWMTPE